MEKLQTFPLIVTVALLSLEEVVELSISSFLQLNINKNIDSVSTVIRLLFFMVKKLQVL